MTNQTENSRVNQKETEIFIWDEPTNQPQNRPKMGQNSSKNLTEVAGDDISIENSEKSQIEIN